MDSKRLRQNARAAQAAPLEPLSESQEAMWAGESPDLVARLALAEDMAHSAAHAPQRRAARTGGEQSALTRQEQAQAWHRVALVLDTERPANLSAKTDRADWIRKHWHTATDTLPMPGKSALRQFLPTRRK